MALAHNFNQVIAFQDYCRTYGQKLLSLLYHGNPTSKLVNHIPTMKGKKAQHVLTQFLMNQKLIRRYQNTFAPTQAFEFMPRMLVTEKTQVDQEIIPTDFEDSYLAMYMKAKGQDAYEIPFEEFIMSQYMEKISEEIENAQWNAVKSATPAPLDPLDVVIDGFYQILKTEALAANITPVITGALTNANIVAAVEDMYKQLSKATRYNQVDIFMSIDDEQKFIQDYRERYGKYITLDHYNQVKLDVGRANFHFLPGCKENAIVITPKENLYYGYDGEMDQHSFHFHQQIKSIEFASQHNIGVQFGIVADAILVCNDQAVL